MSDLEIQHQGETTVLRMTRAPVNALGPEMLAQMDALMDDLTKAPPVRGLVIAGLEKSFCAGIDTKALAAFSADEKAVALGRIDSIMAKLYSLPIPTVAAVQGHAIGAGFIIALACDWKFLGLGPGKLGLNQVAVGIKYPPVPINIVMREIPEPTLRRLTLGGDLLSTEDLARLDVFDAAVAPEELLGQAIAKAQSLAAHPGFATVKDQVRGETATQLRSLAGVE
ncbi:MAG: enoyl-CoA hydratase/isomerase family protein [Pseudomonadota bacterium]